MRFKKFLLFLTAATLTVATLFTFGIFAEDTAAAVAGDANGDGLVNSADLILIRQYLAAYNYDTGESTVEIADSADINLDGKINLLDIVDMRSFLADPDHSECSHVSGEPNKDDNCNVYCSLCSALLLEAQHDIVMSAYNESDHDYDQTCSRCGETVKSPINYVIGPELLQKYYADATNMNFSGPAIYEENGISFARYTKTESGAAFFFPYVKNNTTLVTGEYFVIKYRISADVTSQTSWPLYAGTETMKALDENDYVVSDMPFYDDGGWHIAVIKLDNTKGNFRFIPDENGDYYANYVRVGYNSTESGSTFDIQYAGFADNPDLIINLTGAESFGDGVTCTHYSVLRVNDRQTHVGVCVICGESVEESHSIVGDVEYSESDNYYLGTCSVCGGKASTPFNLYIDPEDIVGCFNSSSYGKANITSIEIFDATDNDIGFARITPKTAQSWMNLYLYLDTSAAKVTGQYAVIKYRIPDTTYAKSSIICYTGSAASSTEKATVGASFTFSNVTASGEWIIAVYDMSKTSEYGANEDGTFSAKYLRLDMLVDEYADVAFFGICDEIGAISSVAEGAVCHHPYYNYSSDAETHTRTECAICREAVAEPIAEAHSYSASTYDGELGGYVLSCTLCKKSVIIEGNSALTVFFDPALIKNSEHSGYSNPFTSASLLSDASESLFLRLSGPGIGSSAIPFTTLIHNKVSVNTNSAVGRYIIIKYRYSASLEGKVTTANLFISSLSAPTASENNKLTTYVTADGNWHYIIIDAKNIGTTEGFEGDIITLLRFDMIKGVTPTESDYVDIAYVAIDESIDALRRFDGEYDTYGLVGSNELKGTIGDIATEKTDSEHNNMPYVTVTGKSGNFTLINNQNIFFQGTGKYVAMLYRKDNSNPALSAGRLYFSTAKNYDNSVLVPYTSDGKWHLGLFDMSEYAAYADGMAKTIRFDWFNFNSTESSIDIAYVKFFDSLEEVYSFYGEYVKQYLDADSCDHLSFAWDYGQDSDPSTDVLKEFGKCAHCVAQMDASRNVSFGLELDRVTDSVSCYPSAYDAAVGNSENEVLVFNSAEFSEIYPADGIHVAVGQEISIAGVLTMKDAVGAFWFKVTESDGNTVSDWRECRYALSSSTVPEGLVATKFAAYADLDGVSGTGLKVIFAVIPQGLPESITDRYLPVTSIENVSIDENITEKVGFTASGDLGILMDDIFDGNRVVNETIMFLDYGESRTLLYDIDRIISVKSFDGTVTYVEGMDYALVDGKIQILEGSSIPCITSDIYYGSSQYDLITSKDGVPTPTYEGEGKSMTRWQVNVEYEHSGSYAGHKQNDQSDYFADLIEKLMNGEDVTVLYFGDSITVGASSTFYNGYAPYQYGYAYLLTHALADAFGYTVKYVDTEGLKVGMIKPPPANDYVGGTRGTITYVNTAVGGWTSANGWSNFEKHVADYIREYGCDLFVCGFGMNDKNLDASITAENIGKIVDGVIALEPDTAVMLVASMLYNNTDVYAETYNANIKNQDSALKTLAESYRDKGIECGVASVGLVSESVLERKEFRDYTGNNINHPNDFFCRIYAQTVFKALIGYENLAD